MSRVTSSHLETKANDRDDEYSQFLVAVMNSSQKILLDAESIFETTCSDKLWKTYLNGIPIDHRQHYNCRACQKFIERFGGLVVIRNDGGQTPVMWYAADTPALYLDSVRSMEIVIKHAGISGLFVPTEQVLGTPQTGIWSHFAAHVPTRLIYKESTLKSASQFAAEKKEEFGMLRSVMPEFTSQMIQQAVAILQSDVLYRSEKVLGVAEWLLKVRETIASTPQNRRDNILWKYVAQAPPGFCHVRSSMIGTLLEDIRSGLDINSVAARFKEKMHPLQYQRPQSAPKSGNIAAAEKIVEKLSAAGSLERRFARLDDLQPLWIPSTATQNTVTNGVFSGVQPRGHKSPERFTSEVEAGKITWVKFEKSVLPNASNLQVFVDNGNLPFVVFVTALNPTSPPIFQWDSEEHRNSVSWYCWHGGAQARQFGLNSSTWCDVEMVTFKPSMWDDPDNFAHQGKSVSFIIKGAKETRQAGNAIFPECLKSEFHGIRAVIESYSKSQPIHGMKDPHACGLVVSSGGASNLRVRANVSGTIMEYHIDRWD